MTFPKQITSEFTLNETDLLFRKLKDYDDTVIFYTQALAKLSKDQRQTMEVREFARRTIVGANSILGNGD